MERPWPFWQQVKEDIHEVEQRIVSHNYTPGRIYSVTSIVIHSMTDLLNNNIDSVANYFNNPDAKVSAHFGVSSGGQIMQFVRLGDTAWANGVQKPTSKWLWKGNPNPQTVSIECEGGPDDPVSDEMYNSVLYTCKCILLMYSSITHLYAHSAISPTQCPGPRWLISGKLQQLGNELGLEVVI